ncbi:MAG: Stp1/IreP family PP2C-type Ser/Thr phosphatase [Desulfuromonadales bacterium]|nr:Stp1/IreP family PP2C-type Ser/Thr phosphatase [Desulfuromonadales bacterium]
MLKINSAAKTDIGMRRSNNEDAFLARPEIGLFAVADGMGGAAAGEVASRIFVDTTQEIFAQVSRQPEQDLYILIQEAFRLGNDRMIGHVASNPQDRGMGCTAELIVFSGDTYIVGHVGDSRTYLYREGKLRQITKDHSLVQGQVDQGLITPEEAKRHNFRNIVLRAVGTDPTVSLDLIKGKCLPGDIFLLCSDGLTDLVDDSLIRVILSSAHGLPDKVERLVNSANTAGGSDNITVVLCEISSI